MKVGELIYGFKIECVEEVKECSGTLYTMSHESGARLAFLEREDDNKTFSIAFRTPPEDDTGVFHIIEHSTLCGSKKYPVKEPFVELLKGSLNTYLNALTYEDRTVYPVSSRCDGDFYNLTSVYLDAVFCPLMKENEFIFRQEGWRYEYDGEAGELSYNGVVYNEMKGAYSSPDEAGFAESARLLYGDLPYGRDSGGRPENIPELTYEEFCRMHDKYYRPDNAYIFLDGRVDLSAILPLIGSYLKRGEAGEPIPSISVDVKEGVRKSEIYYECSEDSEGKARLLISYPFSDYSRTDEKLLSSVIISHLASSNDSPVVKALLDSGLCEDVIMSVGHSKIYTLTTEIKGFSVEDKEKLIEIYERAIEKECLGMDKSSLHANLNRTEFKLRERDLGSFPVGVSNALSVYEIWCYGGRPYEGLIFEDDLVKIRRGIDEGAAEELLVRMIRDNPTRAEVLMLPDPTLGEKKEAALKASLSEKLSAMSSEELSKVRAACEKFALWQSSEDSEEAVATLPRLTLADIVPTEVVTVTEREELRGATVLKHKVGARGIVYTTVYFNASDLTEEELPLLTVLSSALANLKTESYSVRELKKQIKASLGGLAFSGAVVSNSKRGVTYPALRVTASSLSSNTDKQLELITEILTKTDFSDHAPVKKLLTQAVSEHEDAFASGGESVAMGRADAMTTVAGRMSELVHGYEFYLAAKRFLKEISEDPRGFMNRLSALLERLYTAKRAIISVTADDEHSLAEGLVGTMPEGEKPAPTKITVSQKCSEGIVAPSEVGYAVIGAHLPEVRAHLGSMRVARSILSYEYLWNEIRVKGGAYGAGFVPRKDGTVLFYSYRDPSPERSLSVYSESANYLRAVAKDGRDLTKFIIGAYGEYDMIKTPKTRATIATAGALTDWTSEDEKKLLEGLLSTDTEALLCIADLIEKVCNNSATVVVAGERTISSFKKDFDKIIKP